MLSPFSAYDDLQVGVDIFVGSIANTEFTYELTKL